MNPPPPPPPPLPPPPLPPTSLAAVASVRRRCMNPSPVLSSCREEDDNDDGDDDGDACECGTPVIAPAARGEQPFAKADAADDPTLVARAASKTSAARLEVSTPSSPSCGLVNPDSLPSPPLPPLAPTPIPRTPTTPPTAAKSSGDTSDRGCDGDCSCACCACIDDEEDEDDDDDRPPGDEACPARPKPAMSSLARLVKKGRSMPPPLLQLLLLLLLGVGDAPPPSDRGHTIMGKFLRVIFDSRRARMGDLWNKGSGARNEAVRRQLKKMSHTSYLHDHFKQVVWYPHTTCRQENDRRYQRTAT